MAKRFTKTGYAGTALLTGALFILLLVVILFRRDQDVYQTLTDRADRIHQIIDTAPAALSALKDAETGQRGYLLTGNASYLEPYSTGIHEFRQLLPELKSLTAGDPVADTYLRRIQAAGDQKMAELAEVISLYNEGRKTEAAARVDGGSDQKTMEDARASTAGLLAHEEADFTRANLSVAFAVRQTRNRFFLATFILSVFMVLGTVLLSSQINTERRLLASVEGSERRYRELAQSLEEQVADRTRHLEDVNRSLNSFSYSVSHDLRAPLRSIDGFSLMVLEDYSDRLDETGRDMLRRIRAAASRMGLLIQSLLDLSRVTATELCRETVSISGIAESIVEDLRSATPGRNVEVIVEPGLETWADPSLMRVVLDNLLSNAWKFSARRDPARIEVGKTRIDGVETFFVRDNGAGFDTRFAERLFTPFGRLHSSTEFEGAGIGLATVQRVIQRHDGTIWAKSNPGQGSTFFFRIPGVR